MFSASLFGSAARLEIQSHASSAPYSSSPPLVLSCSGHSRGACLILNLGGINMRVFDLWPFFSDISFNYNLLRC